MPGSNDFLQSYTPLANDISQRTGLDPGVVLGIIDTETGGGTHVYRNNLFGITPRGGVAGYPDVQTASDAFVSLMQTPRYRGVTAAPDPASQAAALVKGGYNTVNPAYATIITNKAIGFAKQLGYQDGGGTASPAQPAQGPVPVQPAPSYDSAPAAASAPAPAPAQPVNAPSYDNAPAPAPAPPPAQQGQPKSLTEELEEQTGGAGKPAAAAQDGKPKSLTEELENDIKNPPASTGGLTGPPERGSLTADLLKPQDTSQGYFDPGSGAYVPPAAMPSKDQAKQFSVPKSLLGLPDQLSPDQAAAIRSPTALERVIQAAGEGWKNAPTVLAPGQEVSPTSGLGVNRPLVTIGNALLGAGSAAFRGGQQFLQEATPDVSLPSLPSGVSIPFGGGRSISGQLTPGSLGREVAAMPEAFPMGGEELGGLRPAGPATPYEARQGANRGLLQVTPGTGKPVTLEELTGAVRGADQGNVLTPPDGGGGGGGGGASALNPNQAAREAAAQGELEERLRTSGAALRQAQMDRAHADLPPVSDGDVRLYHGGDVTASPGGARWVTPDYRYARDFNPNSPVNYVDVAADHPAVEANTDPSTGRVVHFNAPADIAERLRPITQGAEAAENAIPEAEAPQPQAAGAAPTPGGAIPAQSNLERARNLRTQIDQGAADRAGPGLRDDTPYVTDIPGGTLPTRTVAQRDFSNQTALDHKVSYETNADYRAAYDKIERARNQGMLDLLGSDAGDQLTLDALRQTRKSAAPDTFGAFNGERPVDASGLVQHIDRVLDSREGKRDAVERTMNNVRTKLYDRSGNLETSPSKLYGAVQHIDDLLEKARRPTDREGSDAAASRFALNDLKDATNNVITGGAPRYQAYRQAYRELSQPVNQQRFLQRYPAAKLTGRDGNLDLGKLNKMLDDIHGALTDPKFNTGQSLTDAQIQNVVNVRNEVAARQLLDVQGRVRGSDTFQKTNRAAERGSGALGAMLHAAAGYGGHALAMHLGFPGAAEAGAIYAGAAPFVRMARQQRRARLAAQQNAQLRAHLLSQPDNPLSQY